MTTETEQKCRDCAKDILLSCDGDVTRVEYVAAKIAAMVSEETDGLKLRIEQLRGMLGYSIAGDIQEDPTIKNGIAEALSNEVDQLRIALDLAHQNENRQAVKINNLRLDIAQLQLLLDESRQSENRMKETLSVKYVHISP